MSKLITANIATQPSRLNVLSVMLESIKGQFDKVRVCLNDFDTVPTWLTEIENLEPTIPSRDLTDNGKYLGLETLEAPEYYLTLDDDIVYPENYASKTVENIERFGCIVTYHGRLLRGFNLDYYQGHKFYHCTSEQKDNFEIDIVGTGVTGFDTDYFKPEGLAYDKRQRMTDVIFSESATMQNKILGICAKPYNWIKPLDTVGIFNHFQVNKHETQKQICNEIYRQKYNFKAV
jgi:hypothetical protein